RYIARSDPRHYQPTNIAFGLLPELPQRVGDKARKRLALSRRALDSLERFRARLESHEGSACSPREAPPASGPAPREARDRRVSSPSRTRAQRLPSSPQGIPRGPGAAARASAAGAGARAPARGSRPPVATGLPRPAPSRRPGEGIGSAEARDPAHVLPLPVPRGDAGPQPG